MDRGFIYFISNKYLLTSINNILITCQDYLNFEAVICHYFCNGQYEIWEMSKFYNYTFVITSAYANHYVFNA